MDYNAIGKRIRAQRLQLNLSQEELAEMVGISAVHMSPLKPQTLNSVCPYS